jgi:diguanylate cyclase (GGDEF)-like protein
MPYKNRTEPRLKLFLKKRSLIGGLAVFILFITLSLASLAVWDSWQEYEKEYRQAEVATSNMARALGQHAGDTIRSVDSLVVALVNTVENQKRHNASLLELQPFLIQRIAEMPNLQGLFILDEHGIPIANSQPMLAKNYNYADRGYFIHHREFSDRGPYIGPPIHSKTTNELILTISRRVNNPDGSFAGAVIANIKLDYFKYFYEEFDIGKSGVIFLANESGTLLVRRPFIDAIIGTSIAGGLIFNEYRTKGPIGTAMLQSIIDKKTRLYSYRHLEDYPLLIAVGFAKEDIFSGWRLETYRFVAICCILVTVLGAFGIYLIMQVAMREASEHQLQAAKHDLEVLNHELAAMASEDGMTGLSNRRKFDDALQSEFRRAARNRSSLALILIDVDRFKQFNDMYGHPAGDDCLVQIAQVLKKVPSRSSDLVARYGGEELVVLLPDTDLDGAHAIAERIRSDIESLSTPHAGNQGGTVTISAGVAAIRPTLLESVALKLLKDADEALYNAKAAGRNRVIVQH